MADYLRENGMDVLITGNAKRFDYKKTIIYDRTGNIDNAFRLGNLLGTNEIYSEKIDDSIVDVTVILGRDIEQLLEKQ